jgi:hypothetical protein
MKKAYLKIVVLGSLTFSGIINSGFFQNNKILAAGIVALKNPLSSTGDAVRVTTIFGRFLKIILGTVVFVSLIMFLWAGYQYMTADGKGEKTGKARETMLWAVLGIVASFSAYTIIKTIFGYIIF